jgi:hypothetical protein
MLGNAYTVDSNMSDCTDERTEQFILNDPNLSHYMTGTSNIISQNLFHSRKPCVEHAGCGWSTQRRFRNINHHPGVWSPTAETRCKSEPSRSRWKYQTDAGRSSQGKVKCSFQGVTNHGHFGSIEDIKFSKAMAGCVITGTTPNFQKHFDPFGARIFYACMHA